MFRELVASVPDGHFQAVDAHLLEQYAQAIILAREAFRQLQDDGVIAADGKPSPWLAVLEKSHKSAIALSARLRLAPQSRMSTRTAARNAAGPRPSAYDLMGVENE